VSVYYAGYSPSGAPTVGVFTTGAFVNDAEDNIWVCTSGGNPGSWKNQGPNSVAALIAALAVSNTSPWTSVTAAPYNADPTGATDSTAGIQAAISAVSAASGGYVYFPPGTYKISSALSLPGQVTLLGASAQSTLIEQVTANAHGITLSSAAGNVNRPVIQGLLLYGTGAGTGIGIYGAPPGNDNAIVSMAVRDVIVSNWGSWGISIDSPDFSEFDNVVSTGNGQGTVSGGYSFTGAATGSASCTMRNCYASSNKGRGYYLSDCNYWSLTGCACDGNYLGYEITSTGVGGFGIALTGCGCETTAAGGGLDGTSFKISGACEGVSLVSCLSVNNDAVAFWATGTVKHATFLACTELSPGGGATASFKTDVSTSGYVIAPTYTTATSFSGTYSAISDTLTLLRTVNLVGVSSYGEVDVTEVGAGLAVAEGSNAKQGTATLNGTTSVVVSNTSVTANSRIMLTIQTRGSVNPPGSPYVVTRSAGVSFSIASTVASDNSTVAYEIFEPG
jgi:parallel beta-helix repeat protein